MLVEASGSDAEGNLRIADTMFEDIGHSSEAKNLLKKYIIGSLKENPGRPKAAARASGSGSKEGIPPLAILFIILAIAAGYYYTQVMEKN